MNKVIMMGRLTRDPEIRMSSSSNNMVASYTLAVDRKFKREGEPDADFFFCTCFGKTAEFVEKYLKKGTKILITGRVQNDNYTNRNGEKIYSTKIIVDEQEFAESKGTGEQAQAPAQEWTTVPEEDLPFN